MRVYTPVESLDKSSPKVLPLDPSRRDRLARHQVRRGPDPGSPPTHHSQRRTMDSKPHNVSCPRCGESRGFAAGTGKAAASEEESKRMNKRLFVVALIILSTAGLMFAQLTPIGRINGKVVDQQGSPLPGVTVEADSPRLIGKAVAVTDGDGVYRLMALASGTYEITFTLPGFKTLVRKGIVLELSQTLALNVTLEAGHHRGAGHGHRPEPAHRRQEHGQGPGHDQGNVHGPAPGPGVRFARQHHPRRPEREHHRRPLGRRRHRRREHVVRRRRGHHGLPLRRPRPERRPRARRRGQGHRFGLQRRVRRLDGRRHQRHHPFRRQRVPWRHHGLLREQPPVHAGEVPGLPAARPLADELRLRVRQL